MRIHVLIRNTSDQTFVECITITIFCALFVALALIRHQVMNDSLTLLMIPLKLDQVAVFMKHYFI